MLTNERTIEELRAKWQKETPFYYHLDHEGAGILFAEIDRLRGKSEPSAKQDQQKLLDHLFEVHHCNCDLDKL